MSSDTPPTASPAVQPEKLATKPMVDAKPTPEANSGAPAQPAMKFNDVKLKAHAEPKTIAPKTATVKVPSVKAAPVAAHKIAKAKKPAKKPVQAKPAAKATKSPKDLGGLSDLLIAGDEVILLAENTQGAATEGFLNISKEIEAYSRHSLEEGWKAAQAILTAKTLPEAFDLQFDFYSQAIKSYNDLLRSLYAISIDFGQKELTPIADSMDFSLPQLFGRTAA